MRNKAITLAGATLGLGVIVLAGCASPTTPEADAADAAAGAYDCANPQAGDTLIPVTVAAQPIVSNGALYAGVDEGFFAEHGLDLEIQPVANIAASIASVQGGTSNFGYATTVSILQAVDNAVPLTIIAPFAGIAPEYYEKMQAGEEGYTTEITALVASKASGAESPKDLEGLTVAVADVKGQSELTTRYAIDADGGDPDAVSYTVMAFPDALNAFKAGQVDAIFTVDPFLSQAEDEGGTVISWPGVETFHEGPTSAIIASDQYVADNGDTVARFNCAIRESATFANENPDAIRTATAVAQNVEPDTLAAAIVPYFYTTLDLEGLERFKTIMLDDDFLTTDVDIDAIVAPVAVAD